ncbi:MAG: hypothetical protein JWL86_3913 [Rhizobium sp.]|nr:hypothetical protein [Rhizobium sp.]
MNAELELYPAVNVYRHCERSEAIHTSLAAVDCFAPLTMTNFKD